VRLVAYHGVVLGDHRDAVVSLSMGEQGVMVVTTVVAPIASSRACSRSTPVP
jgi:adenylylsulfate kinase-like enzyme